MKKCLFLLTLSLGVLYSSYSWATTCGDCGKLIIAAGIEATNGALPDAEGFKVCANDDISDLSVYTFLSSSSSINAGNIIAPADDGVNFTFPSVSLKAGECLWIAEDGDGWTNYFGTAPDYVSQEGKSNGTYPAWLTCLGQIEDVYGGESVGSTSHPANYNNSWFHSSNGRCPNYGSFDVANWIIGPDEEAKGTSDPSTLTIPTSYTAGSCAPCWGDFEVCAMVGSCVPDNQFYMSIPYTGTFPGATLEIYQGSGDIGGDDPATVADGVIEISGMTQNKVTGLRIDLGNGCVIERMARSLPGCEQGVCLWGGQRDPYCEGSNLIVRLDPFGSGIGANGYTIEPDPTTGGTISPTSASYGAVTNFTASGFSLGAGGTAFYVIKDVDNPDCTVTVPVREACEDDGGGTCSIALTFENATCVNNGTEDVVQVDMRAVSGSLVGVEGYSLNLGFVEPAGPYAFETVHTITFPYANTSMVELIATGEGCQGTASFANPCFSGGGGIVASLSQLDNPCGCNDANNVDSDNDGNVDLFLETITITDDPGATWTMDNTSTGVLDNTGAATIPTFVEGPDGTYTVSFYHSAMSGYTASFSNGEETLMANATCGACGDVDAIPTMSEWGLILLALLLMTFGTLLIGATKASVVGTNYSVQLSSLTKLSTYPFDKTVFVKAAALTLGLIILFALGTLWVYGTIALVDIVGTAVTAPIFTYLVHLLFLQEK